MSLLRILCLLSFVSCLPAFDGKGDLHTAPTTDTPTPAIVLELTTGAYQLSNGSQLKSCQAYIESIYYHAEGSGLYWLDVDESGPGTSIKAYCDMVHDGGGWTLITSRRGGGFSIESCGSSLNEFFQNPCGSPEQTGYTDSYNIGDGAVRSALMEKGEWLFVESDSNSLQDTDDAYVIHKSSDIFFDSIGVLNKIPLDKVCDYNNSNCVTANPLFYWNGDGWFSSSLCSGVYEYNGAYLGMYGYCSNDLSQSANEDFGNRGGFYHETKLWGLGGTLGESFQEKIYLR